MTKKRTKNRDCVWIVMRCPDDSVDGYPIAVFYSAQSADEYKGAAEQQFKDSRVTGFHCMVTCTTFYNE